MTRQLLNIIWYVKYSLMTGRVWYLFLSAELTVGTSTTSVIFFAEVLTAGRLYDFQSGRKKAIKGAGYELSTQFTGLGGWKDKNPKYGWTSWSLQSIGCWDRFPFYLSCVVRTRETSISLVDDPFVISSIFEPPRCLVSLVHMTGSTEILQ